MVQVLWAEQFNIDDIKSAKINSPPRPRILSRLRTAYTPVNVLTMSCHGVKRSVPHWQTVSPSTGGVEIELLMTHTK